MAKVERNRVRYRELECMLYVIPRACSMRVVD
jgi:hypothetical protein